MAGIFCFTPIVLLYPALQIIGRTNVKPVGARAVNYVSVVQLNTNFAKTKKGYSFFICNPLFFCGR